MKVTSTLHCRSQWWRIEQHLGKSALIFDGEVDDEILLYPATSGILHRRDHEIAQASPFQFGGVAHDGEGFRRNTRL
jgi:hypothetical protein